LHQFADVEGPPFERAGYEDVEVFRPKGIILHGKMLLIEKKAPAADDLESLIPEPMFRHGPQDVHDRAGEIDVVLSARPEETLGLPDPGQLLLQTRSLRQVVFEFLGDDLADVIRFDGSALPIFEIMIGFASDDPGPDPAFWEKGESSGDFAFLFPIENSIILEDVLEVFHERSLPYKMTDVN
jgi:hypothetical protein